MKTLTTKMFLAAAALTVVAGSASAQMLRAEIPFTFRVGDRIQQPGAYEVNMLAAANRNYFTLRNTETRKAVLLSSFALADVPKQWRAAGIPKLAFECSNSGCVLRDLWSGSDPNLQRFQAPRIGRAGEMRIAEVAMTWTRGD